jgi:molybdopterin synthase catalytic subunit
MMLIAVRAFASYREAIGAPSVKVNVPEGTTAGQIWETLLSQYPRLLGLPRPHAFAINDEYVPEGRPLRERDELVLIPPVSGGTESCALTDRAIDLNAILQQVAHPQAGGVVVFLGTVRDNSRGRRVQFLEYEAYQPMALKEMRRVAADAQQRWPLLGIAIVHRLGHLQVGEVSVAIAVASAHRKDAFEAGRFAIDSLKQTVPIWKKEVWDSGSEWVGSER